MKIMSGLVNSNKVKKFIVICTFVIAFQWNTRILQMLFIILITGIFFKRFHKAHSAHILVLSSEYPKQFWPLLTA